LNGSGFRKYIAILRHTYNGQSRRCFEAQESSTMQFCFEIPSPYSGRAFRRMSNVPNVFCGLFVLIYIYIQCPKSHNCNQIVNTFPFLSILREENIHNIVNNISSHSICPSWYALHKGSYPTLAGHSPISKVRNEFSNPPTTVLQ